MTVSVVVAAILPALASALTIALLRRSSLARVLEDRPNERSLHADPRPRVGGIGVMVGAMPVAFALGGRAMAPALVLAVALSMLSLVDDRRSLPIWIRLPAHFAAAAAIAFTSLPLTPWIAPVAALVAIAWMTNLFNFMDGADGLAGGMGAIGFATLAAGAIRADDVAMAATCLALASACAGFLAHNFPPARVFLGDAGSIPLGFLAGALGVLGMSRATWPAWFPVLAFLPFIADATLTLARRLVRGEAFWRAHRSHLYQRLVLAGFTHRRLAFWSYALMSISSACAWFALHEDGLRRTAIIGGWTAALLLLFAALERRLSRAAGLPHSPRQDR